jgi:hypothetical protein
VNAAVDEDRIGGEERSEMPIESYFDSRRLCNFCRIGTYLTLWKQAHFEAVLEPLPIASARAKAALFLMLLKALGALG